MGDTADSSGLSGKALKKARRAEKLKNERGIDQEIATKIAAAVKVPAPEKVTNGEPQNCAEKAEAPPAKPALTKAERRAKQEAQRAAKQTQKAEQKPGAESNTKQDIKDEKPLYFNPQPSVKPSVAFNLEHQSSRSCVPKKVSFFQHLPQFTRECNLSHSLLFSQTSVHPLFMKLGAKLAARTITDSNEQASAFIQAFLGLLESFRDLDPAKTVNREVEHHLKPNIQYLELSRPLPVSTRNCIKFIKSKLSSLSIDKSNSENFESLKRDIENFKEQKIDFSSKAISEDEKMENYIKEGENLLIFGESNTVIQLLLNAKKNRKINFTITIIDSRPNLSGKESLIRLEESDIQCTYGLITSLPYLMPKASKVLIGAQALLGNGAVMGCSGTGLVLLSAKTFRKPTIVCCETYKFSERIQTDSIVFNELADPAEVLRDPIGSHTSCGGGDNLLTQSEFSANEKLTVLNCVYDVSPASFVSMVVTEVGHIPVLSVPIIYRWKCGDLQEY